MIKYTDVINTGKGFITHADIEQDGLSFVCLENLTKIIGDEIKINAWIKRVNGTEMTNADYELQKAIKEKIGLIQIISRTQKELNDYQTNLDIRTVYIETNKVII